MLFSDFIFVIYFLPLAFIIYHLFFFSRSLQNIVLFLLCIAFYAVGQTVFVFVILFSIIWNWGAGLLIEANRNKKRNSKIILGIAIGINLAVLVFFKQLNPFLSRNFSQTDFGFLFNMGLPIGLSYYTLQAISYLTDIYWGEYKAEKNIINIGIYLSFFPKIIAGPIVSYSYLKEQMFSRKISMEHISAGLCRFTLGLAKVVLLGNIMGRISDYVFAWSAELLNVPVLLAWLGLIALMLKIYYQLSGFCDMAIGLANMFEYHLPENFDYPFMAGSLLEFWQRWNITLLGWFRNYTYPFLKSFSNKVSNTDTVLLNLFLTWFLYALWHGTGWSIIFWGSIQFIFLLIEHFIGYLGGRRGSWYSRIYAIAVLVLSFVFLRTENIYVAGTYFKDLFGLNENGFLSDMALVLVKEYWLWLLIGIIACFPVFPWLRKNIEKRLPEKISGLFAVVYPLFMIGVLFIVFVYITQESLTPFNYY